MLKAHYSAHKTGIFKNRQDTQVFEFFFQYKYDKNVVNIQNISQYAANW